VRALSGSHGFADDGVVRGYGAYADAVASAAGEGGFWVWGGSGGGGGGGLFFVFWRGVFAVREG